MLKSDNNLLKITTYLLIIGLSTPLFAQITDTTTLHLEEQPISFFNPIDSIEEAFSINKNGYLVAKKNSDVFTLATFLNTSVPIARQILNQQSNNIENDEKILISKGDSIKINYSEEISLETVSLLGKLIRKYINNNLGKYFFTNYWLGGGDYELPILLFSEILLCIKQNSCILSRLDSISLKKNIIPYSVSFYGTDYAMAFGNAIIYVNKDNKIVGFYDIYNFDWKKRGVRPGMNEFYVRLITLLTPSTAAEYKIFYGYFSDIDIKEENLEM